MNVNQLAALGALVHYQVCPAELASNIVSQAKPKLLIDVVATARDKATGTFPQITDALEDVLIEAGVRLDFAAPVPLRIVAEDPPAVDPPVGDPPADNLPPPAPETITAPGETAPASDAAPPPNPPSDPPPAPDA